MNNGNGTVKLLSLALVISITVILALGQETNTIIFTAFGQTLGKPFFEEKGFNLLKMHNEIGELLQSPLRESRIQ